MLSIRSHPLVPIGIGALVTYTYICYVDILWSMCDCVNHIITLPWDVDIGHTVTQFFISYLHNETPIVLSKLTVLKITKDLYLYLLILLVLRPRLLVPMIMSFPNPILLEPFDSGTKWRRPSVKSFQEDLGTYQILYRPS